jgi:transposase-like protein
MARYARGQKSVARFCAEEQVSVPAFYFWRRKLAQSPAAAATSEAAADKPFLPVRLVGQASVTAQLPGGTRLQIPLGDPQALKAVIEALASTDALRAGGDAC